MNNPQRLKILIIEDEEVLLELLQKKLTKEGYEVSIAQDGEQGLMKIKEERPDLILLDIVMPKVDGFEVMEKLKKDPRLSSIPIIIISNSGQPVEIDKALKLGVCDYLVKAEFDPEEVVEKVNKCLLEKKTETPLTSSPRRGQKILIVEDDKFLRDLCQKKLTQAGFLVSIAIDGQEGFEKVEQEKPDLVLLDIILPVIDGFEVLKKIRTHRKAEITQVPVILLSNLGQELDVKKGQALGANDYLIKANVTIDEIIEKIRQTLRT